ncbi:MAG: YeeE/YedE family protein [Polyangiaceae bacterium]
MHDFSPFTALMGGALIGCAATLFLFAHGRICGVSGLFGGLLRRDSDAYGIRAAFVGGLVLAGALLRFIYPSVFATTFTPSLGLAAGAGALVGFGTQLGNGCTSGHGICGISRLSPRSLVATGAFMASGFMTTFLVRHVFGGAS